MFCGNIIWNILDLIFEGSIEIVKCRKVSKWIRYPLIVILAILIMSVIGLLGFAGIFIVLTKAFASF